MQVETTNLDGVLLIKPRVFFDDRGCFFESFQYKRYADHGIDAEFIQDNLSYSVKGTLRGLHYQLAHPQGKLVTVLHGKVLDVAVDIRVGSSTFGQTFSCELSDDNHHQIYIPPGFAHGFCVLSEIACFHYKCTDYYYPNDEYGVAWNDPKLEIQWPSVDNFLISEKDQQHLLLKDIPATQLPYMPNLS